ncbi:phosphoribosylamine--glycine ligase [Spirosomataceae bacterium TFI 002]|nr:phosphoribosylamine--glycine ligase [Spirosomataceae bacterium TFI 002]
MNILVLGSGGREHTFAWKLKQSSNCDQLFVSPGNAGTAQIAVNVELDTFEDIADFILNKNIEMLLVGPEAPLVAGVVDYFKADKRFKKLLIIGPDKAGAQLEGSKDFSKDFMVKYGVPTAYSETFTAESLAEGKAYLAKQKGPYVLKADGLAAGKGVIITADLAEAQQSLHEMLADAKFGEASSKVLVEQYLDGIELSVFVLCDGSNYVILPEAKDYKRIGVGDTGPNTGGMGAVSPVPFAGEEFLQKVEDRVVKPSLNGLKSEGIHYVGFLFIGLMNIAGDPFVIEYNVRMGDPETQVVLPRIKTDFVRLLKAAGQGKLDKIKLKVSPKHAVTSVVVAGGYPEAYKKGKVMTLPEEQSDTLQFHAGTKNSEGQIVTNGGRVMAFTGMARTLQAAVRKSQSLARKVAYSGKYYRKDIGKDLLEWIKK